MVANNYYIVTKWREEFRFCASDFTVGNLGRPGVNWKQESPHISQVVCFQGYFIAVDIHLKGI